MNNLFFKQPSFSKILTNTAYKNGLYADVIAKRNIQTLGDITVSEEATLILRAGNNIEINGQFNFEVAVGAELFLNIEAIEDCQ